MQSSILVLIYLIKVRPMSTSTLNYNEIFNELSILYSIYYVFVYSADFILDLDAKYDMGTIFVKSCLPILLLNGFFIFLEMASQLKVILFKEYVKYKWKEYKIIKEKKLIKLAKLYYEYDKINEAIQKTKNEEELTRIIEKRTKELR